MIERIDKVSSRRVTWTDMESPSQKEVDALVRKYGIHPLAASELLVTTFRPKLENYEDHLYLVLHFPVFDTGTRATYSREIDFVILPYNLITVHYEEIPQLDAFQQLLAGHEGLRERKFGSSSGQLLYAIISHLFSVSAKELEKLEEKINDVEEGAFSSHGQSALREIASLRRDLLNFQKALKPQQAVLSSLADHGKHFFTSDIAPYFNDIQGEYTQLWNRLMDLRETLDILYETNISLLSAHTNEITRILTAFASVLLPLSLIVGLFGMNIEQMPIVHHRFSFWIISLILAIVGITIYKVFRDKKWL